MTREEAIEVIKRRQKCPECITYHDCDACDRDFDKALEIAIEALEHPERNVVAVVPCGNCVSRDAVLDAIKNNYRMAAIDVIEDLPLVQPERPKGEWKIAGMFDDFYKCSCGFKYSQLISRYNFCPNCGADMRGE